MNACLVSTYLCHLQLQMFVTISRTMYLKINLLFLLVLVNGIPLQHRRQLKRHFKYVFCLLLLLWDNSNLYKMYKMWGDFFMNSVEGKKKKENLTIMRSRSRQNFFGHFSVVALQRTGKKCTKCKTRVQRNCFCSLNPSSCGVLVRHRCPRCCLLCPLM